MSRARVGQRYAIEAREHGQATFFAYPSSGLHTRRGALAVAGTLSAHVYAEVRVRDRHTGRAYAVRHGHPYVEWRGQRLALPTEHLVFERTVEEEETPRSGDDQAHR